jgi:hypothetical protein
MWALKSMNSFVNLTRTAIENAASVTAVFFEVSWLNVHNLTNANLFWFRRTAVLARKCDFEASAFEQGIFWLKGACQLSVYTSLFVDVVGGLLDRRTDGNSTCRVIECVFNEASSLGNNSLITSRRCVFHFENATLYTNVRLNTDYCWIGQATWDVTNTRFRFSGATIAFILVCIGIFTTYCFVKGKLDDPGGLNKKSEDRRKSSEWSDQEDAPAEDRDAPSLEAIADEAKDGQGERAGRRGRRGGRGHGRRRGGGQKPQRTYQ